MESKIDKFLVYGVLLIVFLLFLGRIMPPSNTDKRLDESKAKEAVLKHEIAKRDLEIKTLKAKDQVISEAFQKERDSLISSTKVIRESVIVYRKAVEATDLRPDSINLLNEVRIGRKIIVSQEAHINALLGLNLKADSLLDVRLSIIKVQDLQLVDWEARYNNVITLKDAEINAEIKRGVKRFFKGVAVGGLVALILVL